MMTATQVIRLFLVISLLAFFVSCATNRPKSKPTPAPAPTPYKVPVAEDCGKFDKVIRSCTKEIHHAKLFRRLKKIARCETGNKCTGLINSPNSLYHGAFQYSRETWEAQCPKIFSELGVTHCGGENAIYDVCCATMCAAVMISRGGISNWPVCGR